MLRPPWVLARELSPDRQADDPAPDDADRLHAHEDSLPPWGGAGDATPRPGRPPRNGHPFGPAARRGAGAGSEPWVGRS